MKIHHLTPEEALHSLHSGAQGLSSAIAEKRLKEFGPNRVMKARRESIFWQFITEFTHFFALILWLAAAMAFWAHWQDPEQGMALLGFAILGVIVVNGVFSFWQVFRAERAIEVLEKLLPHDVQALRDGNYRKIPASELVPGDVIRIEVGNLIPADCRILEATSMRVDLATVTGESLPKARDGHPSQEESFIHSRNALLAGTTVVSGKGSAVVCATGSHTEFGKIAHLTQTIQHVSFPLQQEIRILSRIVAIVATGLGIAFFLIGLTIPLSFTQNLLFAIGIIVANVPEGLLPTVTLSLAMAGQRMARRNVVIRHLAAVETLGSTSVICTDKTGTLTENRMHVRRLYLDSAFHEIEDNAKLAELAARHSHFFAALHLCHNLMEAMTSGQKEYVGDPTEVALAELADRVDGVEVTYPRVDEFPFDSDRRRMSTLHHTPLGLFLYTKGALETLLPLCAEVDTGNGPEKMTPARRQQYLRSQEEMANQGLRVLAVAYRRIREETYERESLESQLVLTGLVGLDDPPRPEVAMAVQTCHKAGIRVIMITGDHPKTAVAVARQIGLVTSDTPRVITGEQLQRLSAIQLQLALGLPEILFARIAADQKMMIVRALQQKGSIVAVTGDGVNDAPALR